MKTDSLELVSRLIVATDAKAIGAIARTLRERLGLGLRECAARIRADAGHISRLENGKKNWNGKTARAYAEYLEKECCIQAAIRATKKGAK